MKAVNFPFLGAIFLNNVKIFLLYPLSPKNGLTRKAKIEVMQVKMKQFWNEIKLKVDLPGEFLFSSFPYCLLPIFPRTFTEKKNNIEIYKQRFI